MVIMSLLAFFIYLYQTGRLRILASIYIVAPARVNNVGNANNIEQNVNNNNAPQSQRHGILRGILGFFLPLIYSLFPNWEPTELFPPTLDYNNADRHPHQE
eukprot:TRINITY_DN8651_c0_g1_i1.p1 TRINITY_DN8651_c0_g1~~TRINITY_DN8651_c0_g1_i1.p1  ORF type:complete len:101 (+),score=10.33 TRINITY_DN8651_c0_g1_i1:268-570(+)